MKAFYCRAQNLRHSTWQSGCCTIFVCKKNVWETLKVYTYIDQTVSTLLKSRTEQWLVVSMIGRNCTIAVSTMSHCTCNDRNEKEYRIPESVKQKTTEKQTSEILKDSQPSVATISVTSRTLIFPAVSSSTWSISKHFLAVVVLY